MSKLVASPHFLGTQTAEASWKLQRVRKCFNYHENFKSKKMKLINNKGRNRSIVGTRLYPNFSITLEFECFTPSTMVCALICQKVKPQMILKATLFNRLHVFGTVNKLICISSFGPWKYWSCCFCGAFRIFID